MYVQDGGSAGNDGAGDGTTGGSTMGNDANDTGTDSETKGNDAGSEDDGKGDDIEDNGSGSGQAGTENDGDGNGTGGTGNESTETGAEDDTEDGKGEDGTGREEDVSSGEVPDVSGQDIPIEIEEIPPFEMMDLEAYGSMRNMLYSYALTYAEEGSLQDQINEAVEKGEKECVLTLGKDTAENLVILDGIEVTLDLNGHTLSAERRIYDGSLSVITVYGTLRLEGEGSLTPGGIDDTRGITVGDGGHLTMNGGAIKDFDVEGNGAGVLVENKGTCEINGGTITGNTAAYYGGGLFAYDAAGTTLNGGVWDGNRAENGGAIAFNKASGSSYTFRGITAEKNEADEKGGGIYVENAMKGVSLQNIRIKDNTAKTGGGMYFANGADIGMLENSVTISGNHATGGNGGGIWLGEGSDVTLTDGNSITGNTADGVKGAMGGGVYLARSSSFTMTGGEIGGNNALTHGGGVALASENKYGSSFVMSGGIVKENTVGQDDVVQSARYGGGVYIGGYTEEVRISGDAVITKNSGASHGGGIYISDSGNGFLLEGGEISDNSARTNNVDSHGGGLYCATVMTMTGGVVTGNDSKNEGGGVYARTITMNGGEIYENTASFGGGVRSAVTFTMNAGSKIYGNTSSSDGGGIYSTAFIMNEGSELYGNKSSGNGGGVAANGAVTINGGEIYENTASQGGGLYVWRAFTMHGGSIYANTASGRGGGVGTDSGYQRLMTGGVIRDNKAGSNGGGVSCWRGSFEMTGGEITGNRSTGGSGGGIYAYSNKDYWNDCNGERIKISGTAKITGNIAQGNSGGIGVEWGSAAVSGGEITGNTALGVINNTGRGGGIGLASTVSRFEMTGGVLKDNAAKLEGKDIYGTCAYQADKERFQFEIIAADQTEGAVAGSYWLDDRSQEKLTGTLDNREDIEKLKEEDADEEIAAASRTTITYAYTFYERSEGIAQVEDIVYDSVQDAVNAIQESGKKNRTITMLRDNRETVVVPDGVKATLDLNGHVLKGEVSSVIEVREGADLTICDSSEQGTGEIREGKGKKIEGKTDTYGGGLYVAGEVTLKSGAVKNNTAKYGGGIYLGKHGVLTMEGGRIADNNTGRGVLVYDYSEAGTADVTARFTLLNGEICGNGGGGVCSSNNGVAGAEIVMKGGVISDHSNTANYGTGIHVSGGKLTMSGGVIRENKAARGGGIYGTRATIAITGGSIIDNTATNTGWGGGGIWIENRSTCTISEADGETVIERNTATAGGGIYVTNSIFTMEAGKIQGNTATTGGALWVNGNSNITIDGTAVLTGNKATSTAGGIYYGTTASGNNAWFKMPGGAVYGNETNLHPSDIYFIGNSNIMEFPEVEKMKAEGEDYICWFDYRSHTPKKASEIEGRNNVVYDLAASEEMIETGEVCQIQTKNGEEILVKKYASFAAAIADARTMTPEEGEDIVIELLVDHRESVEIPGGLKVTVDLGGHTLNPVKTDFTFYVRENGKLTVKNGTIMPDVNMTVSRGIRIAGGSNASNVAVLEMEDVVLDGFGGNTYGGGIYATGYWGIDLDKVTVRNCSAAERGGGIYASRTGQYYDYDFTMKDSTVTGCSAKEYGGGVYVYVGWVGQNKDLYGIRQITFDHCEITDNHITGSNGGGMYIAAHSANAYVYLSVLGDTVIKGNSAKANGGGLYTENLYKTYLTDMEIAENKTTGGSAGGLRINNGLAENRTAELTNVNVHHNTSYGGGSAGASITSTTIIKDSSFNDNRVLSASDTGGLSISGKIDISDSEICGNSARDIGGFCIAEQSSAWPVTVKNVQVRDNHARNNYGGVYMYQPWNLGRHFTFEGCEITGNTCSNGYGGGMSLRYVREAVVDIIGTTISGNSSSHVGGGIYFDGYSTSKTQMTLGAGTVIENNTAGSSGGGIYADSENNLNQQTLRIQDGVSIRNNTALGNGGGIYAVTTNIEMTGGEISGNTGNYGGGVYIASRSWVTDSVSYYANGPLKMTGGRIADNTARNNGGGIYVGNYCDDEIEISGGEITGNHAAGKGGGVAQGTNGTHIQLLQGGKIYDNSASLGQDVYGDYANKQVSHLNLIPAKDMFDAGDTSHAAIGWLDENTTEILTAEIQGKLARYYALTLLYDNGETVAMIGDQPFTSVQKAVDAIQNGEIASEDGQIPEVKMIKDSVENVTIPGEMTLILNLNGRTLRGHSTAISCQGDLTIVDDEKDQGTITGFGVEAGGGVHVLAGGHVTMKGGQISGCYGSTANMGDNSGTKGGAAVCVDAGTFVLEGGSLNHNNASCGSAVLVRNKAGRFQMLGGTIEENTGNYGAVFINGGSVEIAGGKIRNNTMGKGGGGIYLSAGTLNIVGREDDKVEISGNKATERGGGLYINNGTANLKNVEIKNNATTGTKSASDVTYSAGGGIYANVGRLDIGRGTSIMNNSAVRGGGIYQRGKGTIHMIDGLISKNTAQMGGGVAQYPQDVCKFLLMGGGVYDNLSKLSSSGNDFYSRYEGTDPNYGKNSVVPQLTLINAGSMGNKNYNAWKDDAYIIRKGEEGYNRLGELIGEGQYIIADITMSYNVELTAAHYETEEVRTDLLTDLEVGSITLEQSTTTGTKKRVTGESIWDNDENTKASERTAGEMAELDPENWTESDKTYGGNNHHYIQYTGEDEKYAGDHGNGAGLYEREQMVEWTPGNDSDSGNTLIRTFDKVTYPFTITMQKSEENRLDVNADDAEKSDVSENDVKEGEEEISPDAYYRLWLEVRLPVSTEEADFVTGGNDAFGSMKHYVMETELDEKGNGVRVLRGYWDLKGTDYIQGGSRGDSITIQIYGMKDGDTLKPEFTSWMEGSEDVRKNCESERLTVSASAKYNVTVDYNSALSYTGYFDTEAGVEASQKEMETNPDVVYGTMLGYGVTVELYNDNEKKGLKGIELPADGIEFDVRFKGGLHMDGNPILDEEGKPVVAAPYIWAYKENEKGDLGKALGGTTYSRNMNWNDEDDLTLSTNYAYNAAPLNSGGGTNGCYNGGSWTMTEGTGAPGTEETVVHARLAGYSVNFGDTNPVNAANGTQTGTIGSILKQPYVKAFSAGYVQILFPIEEDKVKNNGYLSILMEAAVTGIKAESISGKPAMTGTKAGDLNALKKYFGLDALDDLKEDLATGEIYYKDNYSDNQFGTYVFRGDGNSDNLTKNNYFMTSRQETLSGQEGNASTPLMSTVYIGGDVTFNSKILRTDDENDTEHYIRPEDFNTQTDNKVEYNYMTALNILQKFDADAYTPIGGANPVIDQLYGFDNKNIGNFSITTSETTAAWSNTKTRNCKLSILYAAKPDGSNWKKEEIAVEDGDADKVYDDGGVADMDRHREENLIYFRTLQDLYDYFGGEENGKCVAILYEMRDLCIRTGRSVSARAGMQVNSDFALTGNTYCTTNDARAWSNYRPVYKEYYSKYYNSKDQSEREKFDGLLYTYTWESVSREENGVTVYGRGLEDTAYNGGANGMGQTDKADTGYQAYFEQEKKAPEGTERASTFRPMFTGSYWNNYIKSQYAGGIKKAGTHNGWISGNTLLINTLEPDIDIYVADFIEGSGGASGKARKSSYNVSNGERTAKFELDPSLGIASGLDDHYLVSTGSLSTGISIDIQLPKKLAYQKGSIRIDYSDKNCGYKEGELEWSFEEIKNADGTTTLRLYTDITDIHKKLPEIFFETFIGSKEIAATDEEEVKNGETLKVRASITPVYGKENQMAAKSNTGESSIKIVKNSENAGYITTETPLNEIGEDLIYDLIYRSKTDVSDIEFVDILPYNGDGRESSFDGAYRVSQVEITFSNEEDYEKYVKENGQLSYLTGQKVSGNTGQERKQLLTSMRKDADRIAEYTADASGRKVVYDLADLDLLQSDERADGIGLYVKAPHVSTNNGFTVRVVLSPKDKKGEMLTGKAGSLQCGDNIYGDSFFYTTGGGDAEPVPTTNAYIRLIGRYISGMVWMDQDNDGKYVAGTGKNPSNDRVMTGVDVDLYQVSDDEHGNKTYEPAKNVYGDRIATVRTDRDGRYQFENLAAGTYMAVFRNDASNDGAKDDADYHIRKGTEDVTPIPFGRLSVTGLDDTAVRSSNYNYSQPCYGDEADSAEGPAGLEAAYLYREIVLPEAEKVQTTPYVSGNWNAGLYYIDQTLLKNWNNMTEQDADKKYGVTFEIKGSYASEQESGAEGFTLEYTMSGNGNKKDVKVEGPFLDEDHHSFTVDASPELGDGAEVQTYVWKLEDLALQAEGRSGRIRYEAEETEAFEERKKMLFFTEQAVLEGFLTETESTGDGTTARSFTANNTQVLYEIDVTKTGEQVDATGIEEGIVRWSGEVGPVLQKGTAFGIYSDEACATLLKEVTAVDAVGSFTNLPGGTYYVKETKAPLFYELNETVFRLEIAYPDEGDRGLPSITLTDLTEGVTQEVTVTPTVDGAAHKAHYGISFQIEDELIPGEISINKKDGAGNALDNVGFRLERQGDETYVEEGVTTDGGKLSFQNLKPGIYILTETATAAGNALLTEPVTITIPWKTSEAEAKEAGISTDGEGVLYDGKDYYLYRLTYEISNEATLKLPETGGTAGAAPALAALALLAAGGYLALRRRKKKG